MTPTNVLLNSLLLFILLSNISFAKESCKDGFCIISLDSLDEDKSLKKIKSSATTLIIKDKKINQKIPNF